MTMGRQLLSFSNMIAVLLLLLGPVQAQHLRLGSPRAPPRELQAPPGASAPGASVLKTEVVPFDVQLGVKVADEALWTDAQAADYIGVANGFHLWFELQSHQHYSSFNSSTYEYVRTACAWNPNATTFNRTAGGTPTDREQFQYKIGVSCNTTFEGTAGIPSSMQLVTTAGTQYDSNNIISIYVIPSLPSLLSPFRKTRSMGFQWLPANYTPPTTTPSNNNSSSEAADNIITVKMEWSLGLQEGSDREPTTEEYDGFRQDVQDFVDQTFASAFTESSEHVYKGVLESSIFDTFWNGGVTGKPHTITIAMDVEFQRAAPHTLEWTNALKQAGIPAFAEILGQSGGLFAMVRTVSWRSVDG